MPAGSGRGLAGRRPPLYNTTHAAPGWRGAVFVGVVRGMAGSPETAIVLIVEDDQQIVGILTDLLVDEGYRVIAGVDGQGLAVALAEPPALVLLDVMMPGMDGVEVCRRLRADARTREVPIVFLTAVPPELLAQQLGDLPYQGVIRKPFHLDEVLATVERFVEA